MQRVEAVEAILDLITQAKEEETVEKLTRARMDMEESPRVPYQSPMDWNGNGNDDDGNRTREPLTFANSLVNQTSYHCSIELGPNLCPICLFLPFPTPTQIPTSTLRRTRTQRPLLPTRTRHPSLTFCATDVHTGHKVYSARLSSFLSRSPHTISFSGALTMGFSFLS